jgi:hypothetical protein
MRKILVARYLGPGTLDSKLQDEVKASLASLLDLPGREIGIVVTTPEWDFEVLDLDLERDYDEVTL